MNFVKVLKDFVYFDRFSVYAKIQGNQVDIKIWEWIADILSNFLRSRTGFVKLLIKILPRLK